MARDRVHAKARAFIDILVLFMNVIRVRVMDRLRIIFRFLVTSD